MKLWSTAKADKLFSLWIRERDGWKCQRCGKNFSTNTSQLHTSHFWGRGHSATRYSKENCVAACYSCHYWKWEKEKQGEYRDFMLRLLGKKNYAVLERKAHTTVQRKEAIKELMGWLVESRETPVKPLES